MKSKTTQLPAEFFYQEKAKLLARWDDFPTLQWAGGYNIDLLISKFDDFNRGLDRSYWHNTIVQLNRSYLIRGLKCSMFDFAANFYPTAFHKDNSSEPIALNLLGHEFKNVFVKKGFINLYRCNFSIRNIKSYILWRNCISVGFFDTLLVIISTALMSLNGIHLKRKKLSKFERLIYNCTEKVLVRRLNKISDHMRKTNIKVIVQSGDSSIAGALAALALKRCGGYPITITHGYVWCKYASTIIPSPSTLLLCWSADQKTYLADLNKIYSGITHCPELAIEVIPVPKISRFFKNDDPFLDRKLNVLIAIGGYLSAFFNSNEFRKHLLDAIDTLKNADCAIFYSLHPHDMSSSKVVNFFSQEIPLGNLNNLENKDVKIDLAVGASTSLLFEVNAQGIPVLQINELKFKDGENIESLGWIDLCQLDTELQRHREKLKNKTPNLTRAKDSKDTINFVFQGQIQALQVADNK